MPTVRGVIFASISAGSSVKVSRSVSQKTTVPPACVMVSVVEIQQGVTIGARTKVQSHAFVCELVTIGADCFIGHGVMFTNDTFAQGGPARGKRSLWKATRVGDRVSIGSNATLLPVTVCDDAVIGAGAVVTRDITEPGVYAGNPARLLRRLESPDA